MKKVITILAITLLATIARGESVIIIDTKNDKIEKSVNDKESDVEKKNMADKNAENINQEVELDLEYVLCDTNEKEVVVPETINDLEFIQEIADLHSKE